MKLDSRLTFVLALGILAIVLGTVSVSAQPRPIVQAFPTGDSVWLGSYVWTEFDRDLDRPSLEDGLTIEPAMAGQFVWRTNRRAEYWPDEPLDPKTRYQVTLGTEILDSRGQPILDRPYSWTFATREDTGQVSFGYGTPIQFVTPSGGRGVPIQPGYPRITLDFALYALDLPAFAERYAEIEPYQQHKIDFSGLTQVAQWSAHVDATETVGEVALPPGTAPGTYVLDARDPRVDDAQTIVIFTDYGLVAKEGLDTLSVWVTKIPGGEPMPGAVVTIRDAAGVALGTDVSDTDGLTGFEAVADASIVTAEVAGQTTLVGLDGMWCSPYGYCGQWWTGTGWVTTPPEYSGHVHTDRPIYRPGHVVHYKATLRHVERDGYSVVAAGTTLTATIKDGGGNTVARANPTTDDFGSIAGDLVLGDDVALGDWRIEVSTGAQTFTGYFKVEEYVKPDYEVVVETDRPFYIRDETAEITVQADYYFGQPAAGADVTLRVFRGYYYYGRGGNQVGEYVGKTDPDGAWSIDLPLPGNTTNTEMYYFEAEVVDATRRPVVQETSVPVHPAAFNLQLRGQRYGVELGEPVVLDVITMGHDGQPAANREVDVEVNQYRRYGNYVVIRHQTVTTGADGRATVTFRDLNEGWYRVMATASDDGGRAVTAYSYAWLYSYTRPWYWYGGLEITADRDSYAPGDTARLLVKSPVTTTALVTLERENVYDEIVVQVSGASTIEVPIKAEYAPNVRARVQLWQPLDLSHNRAEGQLLVAETNLSVPAEDKRLSVEITPDAETHEPQDEATFTVTVRDVDGNPVRAQLSFALVDKAVLALAQDRNGDIFDAFWGERTSYVSTYDSLRTSQWYGYPEQDAGGGRGGLPPSPGQPTPEPSAPGGKEPDQASEATPRREFLDTAYWKADVVTGPDGTAEVTLTLPDNLTTWQALARAITLDTLAGQGTGEMVVAKPIIADPAMPRFAVQGDRFALDVLARNYHGGTLDATCILETPGLVQLDPGNKVLTLPFNETRFARWTVVASELGAKPVTARVSTASGGDAIELPLDVQPFAVPDRFVLSGSTDGSADESFKVPFNAVAGSEVEVRLAPGAALSILDGLEDLIGYPYGCIEQTMSRMLPNAVVGRLVMELDIQAPEITAQLPEMMAMGLQKIYGFQLDDGSWGWWHGERNMYITTYVLHGLVLTQEAGYKIDPAVLESGFTWLAGMAPSEKDARMRAYALYVLALAERGNEAMAVALVDERDALDAFSLSVLALALDEIGRDDLVDAVLDDLVDTVVEGPTTASWPLIWPANKDWGYHWRTMASTEKNTATALLALANLRPESPLAPKAARWLLEHRWGRGWRTTQATAFAVLGLTDYIVASGELWADYDWSVALDGDVVAQGSIDSTNVTERIAPIVLTGDQLTPGDHVLTQSKQGDGTLFYTVVGRMALYYDGFQPTAAHGYGISLAREYTPISGRSSTGGWQVGDVVNVRLTLETDEDLHYMIIEDMLPAGLEALNERLDTESTRVPGTPPPWRWWGYERKEIRDEKVTFFDTYLHAGAHTFDYAARAVTPGVFSARPVEAYAMYRPEVWGRSASARLTIDEERITDRPFLAGDFDRNCRLTEFDASLVAAEWPFGERDLSGDGDVDVADVATAVGRSGLACGDVVPLPPGRAGELSVHLRAPDDITAGQSFVLDVLLEGTGEVGGYELTLRLPDGAFEVLGVEAGDLLPGAYVLGPTDSGNTVRFGGYSHEGAAFAGETVVARLRLRAADSSDAAIDVARAQVVTDDGGEYTVTADGTVVSPEPWRPLGKVYLPLVERYVQP